MKKAVLVLLLSMSFLISASVAATSLVPVNAEYTECILNPELSFSFPAEITINNEGGRFGYFSVPDERIVFGMSVDAPLLEFIDDSQKVSDCIIISQEHPGSVNTYLNSKQNTVKWGGAGFSGYSKYRNKRAI